MENKLRSTDPRLIEAANIAYHEAEAELYDHAHPEILWCERPRWETFGRQYATDRSRAMTIVDLGAGTGFVGDVLKNFLRSGDAYIATDLSAEMLEKLKTNLSDVPFRVDAVVAPADRLPLTDACADIVAVNSALHHFPQPEAVLREGRRLLKPGGVFVIMHEPNILFSRSPFFRQLARAASFLAARIDRAKPGTSPKPDYGPVFVRVNERLLEKHLVREALPASEIQALVDVHSPTARGRYEEVGLDPWSWNAGIFRGWERLFCETYNFLGKLDPTAFAWRRIIDKMTHGFAPRHGAMFSVAWRKPLV